MEWSGEPVKKREKEKYKDRERGERKITVNHSQ